MVGTVSGLLMLTYRAIQCQSRDLHGWSEADKGHVALILMSPRMSDKSKRWLRVAGYRRL